MTDEMGSTTDRSWTQGLFRPLGTGAPGATGQDGPPSDMARAVHALEHIAARMDDINQTLDEILEALRKR